MMDNIFDSHAHYDDEKFDDDRHEVIEKAFSSGVCAIVNCGCDIKSSEKSIILSERYENIFVAVGIHPHSAQEEYSKINAVRDMLHPKKVVAVGEIGLDYHYDFSDRDVQKDVFEKQILIAKQYDLPVIVHSREATMDVMTILRKHRPKGVVHCFTGSVETAKEILSLGMYIGIGGAVTFKNAVRAVEAVKAIPLDKILLETDCPYMTPVPHRGKRNDSSFIKYTAEKIAEIKSIDAQEVANQTKQNALNLFLIQKR